MYVCVSKMVLRYLSTMYQFVSELITILAAYCRQFCHSSNSLTSLMEFVTVLKGCYYDHF